MIYIFYMGILSLHNLSVYHGSKKRKKRLGRGDASGHGSYSTRGIKGQKARSGVGSLKRKGMRNILRRLPKFKGQPLRYPKADVINLQQLEKYFKAGEVINAKRLYQANLIKVLNKRIKILGGGKLTKNLIVVADGFSKSAEQAIIKAGGKVIIRNSKL